jgi:hypothetical protein
MNIYKRKRTKKHHNKKHKTRKNIKKGGKITSDIGESDRQRMLLKMQQFVLANQENERIFNELEDRMIEIEEMDKKERKKYATEYKNLQQQIAELRESNDRMQQEFESLREEYMNKYMR